MKNFSDLRLAMRQLKISMEEMEAGLIKRVEEEDRRIADTLSSQTGPMRTCMNSVTTNGELLDETANDMKNMLVEAGWRKDIIGKSTPSTMETHRSSSKRRPARPSHWK